MSMFEDLTLELAGDNPERGEWTLTIKGPLCKVQDAALNLRLAAKALAGELAKRPCGCKDKDGQG